MWSMEYHLEIVNYLSSIKRKRGRWGQKSHLEKWRNFPNLGRDLDIQVYKSHKSLNNIDLRRSSPRHIIIKLSKIKDKERTFKLARENKLVAYKGTHIKSISRFLIRNLTGQRRVEWYIQSVGGQGDARKKIIRIF